GRWTLAFLFGLIHGFGFANALRDLGLASDRFVPALLGFNLGVELGQALCVATVLGAMALPAARGWPAGRLAPWAGPLAGTRVASVTALLVGSFWVVERLTL
ncbi:MAG: HupE/UreJ family protein, partial [Burkholderiales bacterium]